MRDIKASFYQAAKKKLVIAIALITDPKILLDEPFAALDVMTIKALQEVFVNLQVIIIYQLYYATTKLEIY